MKRPNALEAEWDADEYRWRGPTTLDVDGHEITIWMRKATPAEVAQDNHKQEQNA